MDGEVSPVAGLPQLHRTDEITKTIKNGVLISRFNEIFAGDQVTRYPIDFSRIRLDWFRECFLLANDGRIY